MIVKAIGVQPLSGNLPSSVNIRCPVCGREGTLDRVLIPSQGNVTDVAITSDLNRAIAGMRLCPNTECKALIFFVWNTQINKIAATFPAERLDFDSTNIPASVTKALEEAISCHASQCFIAAAIMVRKTLEELCHARTAAGANLKERIRNLGSRVVLPQELLDGLDDLRLLGNDAAHIESQEFNDVGKDEVEIGIEFAKEVLKAVYQYADLLAKLRALRRSPSA
ncbi:MAG TPA: DUF4145 domain-containing protein [Terracidiphilus sp.]